MKDAHESLGIHSNNKGSEGNERPKGAAALEPEKKDDGDGDIKSPLAVPVVIIPSQVPPLALDFGSFPGAELTGNSEPHGLPDLADKPQPEVAPDGAVGAPGAQHTSGDLAFALRLDPQITSDNSNSDAHGQNASGQPADVPGGNRQAGDVPSDANQGGERQAGQDAPAVHMEALVKSPASAPPLKETRQGQGPEVVPPAAGNEAAGRVAVFQTYEKSMTPPQPEPAAAPRVETARVVEAAASQTPAMDHVGKPSAPLKDLSIQVGQLQHDKVELRVVERSGELQVAVRAANPDLAQGLRQGLSDLVDRLEQNGFRAEAWRPGMIGSAVEGAGEARQKPMQFQQQGSHAQSGGSQQGRQQDQQNQPYRPRWVQELEGNLTSATTLSPGESYGISR